MVDIVHLYFKKNTKKLIMWILYHIIILCKFLEEKWKILLKVLKGHYKAFNNPLIRLHLGTLVLSHSLPTALPRVIDMDLYSERFLFLELVLFLKLFLELSFFLE